MYIHVNDLLRIEQYIRDELEVSSSPALQEALRVVRRVRELDLYLEGGTGDFPPAEPVAPTIPTIVDELRELHHNGKLPTRLVNALVRHCHIWPNEPGDPHSEYLEKRNAEARQFMARYPTLRSFALALEAYPSQTTWNIRNFGETSRADLIAVVLKGREYWEHDGS